MSAKPPDINAHVSGVLRDLAAAQTDKFKARGFKRAAAAVMSLDQPIDALAGPAGALPDLPNIGPSSRKIIEEVLRTGTSARMEREVATSRRGHEITRGRDRRGQFLSRVEVRRVLETPAAAGVVGLSDYRGDFQMHSVWSDGGMTLEELVDGCLARGYIYAAISDHSHGLKIASGMSMEEVTRQHRAIDVINDVQAGKFRLIKGVEANIQADGALDLAPADVGRFEMVLAAPHSQLRGTHDQTARLERAVKTPGVHVLAHPRGRQGTTRAGIHADWDRVFAAAVASNVAIEIDGDPARQDLDYSTAERALAAGCLFALDSDAHSVSELAYADTAVAHARLAGIPADRVLNCWPLERLLDWLARRQGRAASVTSGSRG